MEKILKELGELRNAVKTQQSQKDRNIKKTNQRLDNFEKDLAELKALLLQALEVFNSA